VGKQPTWKQALSICQPGQPFPLESGERAAYMETNLRICQPGRPAGTAEVDPVS
jgi:hypothetical protein